MNSANSPSRWRQWFRPSRLVPLLTILGAGVAITLSLLNVIQLRVAEDIIIALLALLAVDALTERLTILERLSTRLSHLPLGHTLRKRTDILAPVEHAQHASEICILVVHGTSVIPPYSGFYKKKLQAGCSFRVILLDPTVPALETWHLLTGHRDSDHIIGTTLQALRELVELPEARGSCEVRLSQVYLPFSIFAANLTKETGSMNVEYHAYRRSIDERPHVHLTARDNPYWFEYYKQQFEDAWSDATPWTP